MIEHTSKRYENDLETIRSTMLRMGGVVHAMLTGSVEVIETGDAEKIAQILDQEKQVNELEVELDGYIVEVIARQQPTAVDLRLLFAALKMLTDMERSGDEAEKVAKMARRLHETHSHYEPLVEMRHIGTLVLSMLNKLLDAFARNDAVVAAEVVRADKQVDKEWKSLLRTLSSYMIEDPRHTSEAIDLIFIARSLERIGDHAKNMAERIIYLVQGEDVRHKGVKKAEKVAREGSL
ncbi:phosphate signaling complex protein PhoU [Pelistega europaea]|uniref:Phosphate-specific transport system accessory protein PhoU n=1 Tax=Pelistega europaea TaxID=106147 RepID=A0A7Y4LA22_9BURK|nr:phosphate signaling complex protein PhoU [Pelistega europaea]NOL49658.1 phosphate signaling complex protein PhoU [Pelistega europaea]